MNNAYTYRQKTWIYVIIGLFALVYCSISLVNHYFFRTFAFDLGFYNNILYSYSHLKMNHASLQEPLVTHVFADHFEPIFFVFAPFYWIFGSYTLLVIQIALVIWGGVGAMKYARAYTGNNHLSIAILLQFYSMWGVYSALAFDFHNNTTAAMIVPWFMLFVHEKRWKPAIGVWLLILLCKENMALFGIFVCLGLALHYFNESRTRKLMLLLTGISGVYFVLVVKVIIPSFQPEGTGYLYDNMYQALGTTPGQIMNNILEKPGYLFSILFESYYADPGTHGIKSELHFSVLLSGGLLLLYRPQFLVMLIPIYLQKLFNSDPARWGINYHYSIEFVPVITAATAVFMHSIQHVQLKKYLPFGMAAVTFIYTMSKMDHRVSVGYNRVNTRFYTKDHFRGAIDPQVLNEHLERLPVHNNEAISVQDWLVPRLCNRDSIYLFPKTRQARYIVLAPNTCPYILDSSFYYSLDTLRNSNSWKLVSDDRVIMLFERKTP